MKSESYLSPLFPQGLFLKAFRVIGSAVVALCFTYSPAKAQNEVHHESQYAACLALVEDSPEQALEGAIDWKSRGGADAADHCTALAVLALGEVRQAAERLEEIGTRSHLTKGLRAEAFSQASAAWLQTGDLEKALRTVDRAVSLAPDEPRLLVDRGVIRLDVGQLWEAVDDFDAALSLDPNRPEALLFRASAYRFAGAYDLAVTDITRVLNLAPGEPAAFIELAEIRLAEDRIDAAREALLLTIENTTPNDPLRLAAQDMLAEMDVGG